MIIKNSCQVSFERSIEISDRRYLSNARQRNTACLGGFDALWEIGETLISTPIGSD